MALRSPKVGTKVCLQDDPTEQGTIEDLEMMEDPEADKPNVMIRYASVRWNDGSLEIIPTRDLLRI